MYQCHVASVDNLFGCQGHVLVRRMYGLLGSCRSAVETDAKHTALPRPSYADTPSLAKESLLPVSEICETILHDLKESVAFTLSSKLDCANFLGVVRAILLNPTNAIVGLPTKLSKMKKRTPANHITLDSADSSIPGLLQVVHSMVAVEIVHLEECRNIFYLPGGWP